jgi:hypothetical protein
VVYDFQIVTGNTYTPFVIYDLPGKEDPVRTYIRPNVDSVNKIFDAMAQPLTTEQEKSKQNKLDAVFDDIVTDVIPEGIIYDKDDPTDKSIKLEYNTPVKERKSSYVLNPLLMHMFDDNWEKAKDVILSIGNGGNNVKQIDLALEKEIVNNVLDVDIEAINMNNGAIVKKNIRTIYTDGFDISTPVPTPTLFSEIFNKTIALDIGESYPLGTSMAEFGIWEYANYTNAANVLEHSPFFQRVVMLIMMEFIDRSMLDVVMYILVKIVGNTTGDGAWSYNKVHAFPEAININENILGLLSYLRDIAGSPPADGDISDKTKLTKIKEISEYYMLLSLWKLAEDTAGNTTTWNTMPYNNGIDSYQSDYLKIGELSKFYKDPVEKKFVNDFLFKFRMNDNSAVVKSTDGYYGHGHGDTPDGAHRKYRNFSIKHAIMKMHIRLLNTGGYDSTKKFRTGEKCTGDVDVVEPDADKGGLRKMTNDPFIQDYLLPYKKKISFYYVFYVVSNNFRELKGEEQVKLLDNTYDFINDLVGDDKKKTSCVQLDTTTP